MLDAGNTVYKANILVECIHLRRKLEYSSLIVIASHEEIEREREREREREKEWIDRWEKMGDGLRVRVEGGVSLLI